MNKVKVTVASVCYNHEKFIAQALDSILMQETNFKFNIIIGDDASTDNTAKILIEYANQHPDIIKLVLRDKNLGGVANYIDVLSRVESKYVALNEGDDYFGDPLKLQKQVDFLDANPDCSVCFHPVLVKYEDRSSPNYIFPSAKAMQDSRFPSLEFLLSHNFIQTNSCMYRWRFGDKEKIKDIFPVNIAPGDYYLHLLHAEIGKIGFLPDVMSVYRKHPDGLWAGAGVTDEWFLTYGPKYISFYKEVENRFKKKFTVDYADHIQMLSERIMAALAQNDQPNK